MPATRARVVQFGKETTWGTAVAATVRLMGLVEASFQIEDVTEVLPDLGRFAPSPNALQLQQSASGQIQVYGTYEDLPYFLDHIFGIATPSGSDPYTYDYAAPLTTAPTPRKSTIEYGTASASYEMSGGLLKTLRIAGAAGRYWEVSSDVIGEAIAATSLTGSLNDRAVNPIRMADTVCKIDAWAGTIGSTAGGKLVSFEAAIDTMRHLKFFAGSLTPTDFGEDKWTGTLQTVLEFDSTAKAYVDALLSGKVQRQIEIEAINGTNVATLQFAGTLIDGVPLFADRDGNITVELNWEGTYNSTLGNWLKASVTNGVSTLA